MIKLLIVAAFAAVLAIAKACETQTLETDRARILQLVAEMYLGGKLQLSEEEKQADQIIMRLKQEEIEKAFRLPHLYNFSNYFSYRKRIEETELFKIIQRMPKGAALHVHASAMLGQDYLLNQTYLDNLYICYDDSNVRLKFSNSTIEYPCPTTWRLLKLLRENSNDSHQFDIELKKHFTMIDKRDDDANTIWKRFSGLFVTAHGIINYRPAMEMYLRDALESFRSDGIIYVEFRSYFSRLYELDGRERDVVDTARVYKRIIDDFVMEHPDFLGARVIYSPSRLVNCSTIQDNLSAFRRLRSALGDFVAGFDLVGQENLGKVLLECLPLLQSAKDEVPYFFHAGETNWSGMKPDENLIDAILLGSKRLGHAYALLKHPAVAQLVKERSVCLEVNVISNQVLGLVKDLRNHPLMQLLAEDFPVVISSDAPGIWEATPMSHDYYVTLVGVASRRAGLQMLKQLAMNLLRFSALTPRQRYEALSRFRISWNEFVWQLVRDQRN